MATARPKNAFDYIDEWVSQQGQGWLRQLATLIQATGSEPSKKDLQSLFHTFKVQNGLVEGEKPEKDSPKTVAEERRSPSAPALPSLRLLELSNLQGVNALSPGQALTFSPTLTVIYGANGAGKSGYVRVLKRASGAKTKEDILGNVRKSKSTNRCSADFRISLGGKDSVVEWQGQGDLHPLTAIRVFDNRCVKVYLGDKLHFAAQPFGFAIFTQLASSLSALGQMLEDEIRGRGDVKDFGQFFTKGTKAHTLASTLFDRADAEQTLKSCRWTAADEKALHDIEEELEDLSTTNAKDRLQLLQEDLEEVQETAKLLIHLEETLSTNTAKRLRSALSVYAKEKAKTKEAQAEDLSGYAIPGQESDEWLEFVQSAQQYIDEHLGAKYPASKNSRCIYCLQPVSLESKELIKKYRVLLANDSDNRIEELEEALDAQRGEVESAASEAEDFLDSPHKHLERALKGEKGLQSAVSKIVGHYRKIGEAVASALGDYKFQAFKAPATRGPVAELERIAQDIQRRIKAVTSQAGAKQAKRAALIGRRNELSDLRMLSKKRGEILEYIADRKWAAAAKVASRKLSTHSLTTGLSKKAWSELVTEKFERHFNDERSALDAPEVEFTFPGDQARQARRKQIAGMSNIEDILSEGEQKAIALADFFAELAMESPNTPVVFDDPVTSFDHERTKRVAERLVEESKTRQTVVFTHHFSFLSKLRELADSDTQAQFHWIDRQGAQVGLVCQNEFPFADTFGRCIEKAKQAASGAIALVGERKQEAIAKGYAKLRSSCECVVLERVFGGVVRRFDERIRMSRLEDIKFDKSLALEANTLFEEFSAHIDGHSHSEATLEDPLTPEQLKRDIQRVEALWTKLKAAKN